MTTKITKSSGNVYADIGIKSPEEHALKAELVRQIAGVIKEQELTQAAAARRLGIEQPDVSKMLKGHFRRILRRASDAVPRGARTGCRNCRPAGIPAHGRRATHRLRQGLTLEPEQARP